MKSIVLILIALFSNSILVAGRLQINQMYRVLTDSTSQGVPDGKCLITGVVTHRGSTIESANIFSEHSKNVKSDKEGKFRILVDTADTYLVIHKLNLPETYVEYYKFQNKHHIDMEVYIPEENIMIMVDKPVVYLYGKEKLEVQIEIQPKGEFTFTYPIIENKNRWVGKIGKEGINIENNVVPYLFYETKMSNLSFINYKNQIKGSIVNQSEIILFLEESLAALNLNPREKTDFITYWTPKMTRHDKVFVQFWTDKEYDAIATIDIRPQPDNLQRVFMVYAPIKNGQIIDAVPQQLDPAERKGFTVIEWGGSELPNQKLFSIKTL